MLDPTLQFGSGAHRTWVEIYANAQLPLASYIQGTWSIPPVGVGLRLRQQIALLGDDAPALNYFVISFSESWGHSFSTRLSAVASTIAQDSLYHRFTLTLPIYRDLLVDTSFQIANTHSATGGNTRCDFFLNGECASGFDPPFWRNTTQIRLGLSYLIRPEFAIAMTYVNTAFAATRRSEEKPNVLYNPDAFVGLSATLSIDRIYQRSAAKP